VYGGCRIEASRRITRSLELVEAGGSPKGRGYSVTSNGDILGKRPRRHQSLFLLPGIGYRGRDSRTAGLLVRFRGTGCRRHREKTGARRREHAVYAVALFTVGWRDIDCDESRWCRGAAVPGASEFATDSGTATPFR
jgi:hypothetical protein